MIDTKDQNIYDDKVRREILMRALWSQPYYYRLNFTNFLIVNQDEFPRSFDTTQSMGRDFFVTEYQGNFNEMTHIDPLFNTISLYSGYNKSLYRYDTSRRLKTGLLLTEARTHSNGGFPLFDDRQWETLPVRIAKGDQIYGDVGSQGSTDPHEDNATVVIKGFTLVDNPAGYTPTEQKQLNDSLGRDIKWEYFKLTVDKEGRNEYILENDKYPRLILGFGIVNSDSTLARVTNADVSILDISRRLQLTDEAIPIEFIAPRLNSVHDTHLYYLPIEYYYAPLAKIRFDINNVSPDQAHLQTFELVALTRTV